MKRQKASLFRADPCTASVINIREVTEARMPSEPVHPAVVERTSARRHRPRLKLKPPLDWRGLTAIRLFADHQPEVAPLRWEDIQV